MNRSEILKKLEQYKTKHQKDYRFQKIGLFGSVARGEAGEKSDIDILIEQAEPDLFLLGTIKTDLEKELGVQVDIIRIRKGMNRFLANRIAQEAIYVWQGTGQGNPVADTGIPGYSYWTIHSRQIGWRFYPVGERQGTICMQLIAIGEALKNLDKVTDSKLLSNHPQINWKGAKAMRDIISHHYFEIDAEVIFEVCKNKIKPLRDTIDNMHKSV